MKKVLYPLMLALPAALFACGGQESADDLVDESAALALTSDDADADANTEQTLGANEMDMDEAATDQTDAMTNAEPAEGILSCSFATLKEQIFARFDLDHDGKLNADERAALKDELDDHPGLRIARKILIGARRPHFHIWKRIRWAFDVDNNGVLDDAERAELIAASEARCERRKANFIERFDSNGDGTLSRDELAAGVAEVKMRWHEKKDAFLMKYDTNGDGTLDDAERVVLREDIKAHKEQIKAEVKQAFDADGNGKLDSDELAALKAEIRRRYVEGFHPENA